MRSSQVKQWLLWNSLMLLVCQVLSFVFPWVELCIPGMVDDSGCMGIGLTGCTSGEMCSASKALLDSPSSPPWMKNLFENQAKSGAIYNASFYAACLIGLSVVTNLLSEMVDGVVSSEKNLEYRMILKLFSSGLYILSTLVYMAVIHREVHFDNLDIGCWLTMAEGLLSLGFCAYVLTKFDDPRKRLNSTVSEDVSFENSPSYGTMNRK